MLEPEEERELENYHYHLGTIWSGSGGGIGTMDFGDLGVKHEPLSPFAGGGQCAQSYWDQFNINPRDLLAEFPLNEDCYSDPGGDHSPGSISPISENLKMQQDSDQGSSRSSSSSNSSSNGSSSSNNNNISNNDNNSRVMAADFASGPSVNLNQHHHHHHHNTNTTTTNDMMDGFLDAQVAAEPEEDCGGVDGVKRKCLVCSDTASGYHYGVSSCEACKAFFKRTIQGNIEYSCPATSSCEITKRRRKSCQACRFNKCLSVGMLREGVRLDRVRGGRQKYKRVENGTTQIQPLVSSVPKRSSEGAAGAVAGAAPVGDSRYLSTLLALESQLEKMYKGTDIEYTADEQLNFWKACYNVTDRELVVIISWAKQMPKFSILDLHLQMNILQSSWLDVICLNLVRRSCPYTGVLRFAEDLTVGQDQAQASGIPYALNTHLRNVCQKFTDLDVTHEEYVLLKAIVLCNFDTLGQEATHGVVQNLQDSLQDSLRECIRTRQGDHNPRRLGQLFLLLPFLTHLRGLYRDFWEEVRQDGRIAMNKLFVEMLEYCS